MTKHIIIYSHGFGVQKDDRGLFTDIAAALPGAEHVMFDYNQMNPQTNVLRVAPFDEQVRILKAQLAKVRANNPGAVIDFVCHSQGCVVTALADIKGIHRTVFLAPPTSFKDTQQAIKKMRERAGTIVDQQTVTYPRRDGSTTIIGPDYWQSRENIQPVQLYNQLAKNTGLTIINANQDEVLGEVDSAGLSSDIRIKNLDANHDFTDEGRDKLLQLLTTVFSESTK